MRRLPRTCRGGEWPQPRNRRPDPLWHTAHRSLDSLELLLIAALDIAKPAPRQYIMLTALRQLSAIWKIRSTVAKIRTSEAGHQVITVQQPRKWLSQATDFQAAPTHGYPSPGTSSSSWWCKASSAAVGRRSGSRGVSERRPMVPNNSRRQGRPNAPPADSSRSGRSGSPSTPRSTALSGIARTRPPQVNTNTRRAKY
jgi:hypothetical protein